MNKNNQPRYEQIGVAMTSRSFEEYLKMFSLQSETLNQGSILDVASGASSFTAEANRRGYHCISVDPLYELTYKDISIYGEKELSSIPEKLSNIEHIFDWSYYLSVEHHQKLREDSFEIFKNDYDTIDRPSKYVKGTLPLLPFEDNTFSMVLCSHFLFLYHEQFDFQFHLHSIQEFIRVCKPDGEIRIYPLVTLTFDQYPHLEMVMKKLEKMEGIKIEKVKSNLPFIPNSPYFLRLKKRV
ncbi:class I SAM-dependent methyltransferase [Chengkuizengella axinellae]|uniref:Methyltransferase domain-containing protein n=1 Tax=Chengkuizengella axinellae TaxID=3064388 RepID=A0ABT9IYS5_9BACL|nr:methyltransferase domain-containing protein [Chengkuizengella sp. 2205SS18-9]MDP5274526.1 methyltransferase domain-containing protein [Chengkuizengella sp. 2205SS18-9]